MGGDFYLGACLRGAFVLGRPEVPASRSAVRPRGPVGRLGVAARNQPK